MFYFYYGFYIISSKQFCSTNKGDLTLGGQVKLDFSSSKFENSRYSSEENNRSNVSISPRFGFFASENIEIGIGIIYSRDNTEFKRDSDDEKFTNTINLLSINPFIRVYNNFNNNFALHFELDFAYGFGSKEEDEINYFDSFVKTKYEYDLTNISVSIIPAVSYHVNDKLSFEANLGGIFYSRLKTERSESRQDNEIAKIDENYGLSFSVNSFTLGMKFNS